MSHDLHVRFLLEQPPTDALTPSESPSHHELPSFDNPPPWEPHFEDLSALLSSPLPSRRPLDPPPPCFSTTSPLRIRSHNFPPFCIPALGDKLTDGFRLLYPLNLLESHGIGRTDWVRFLEDLGIAARRARERLGAIGSRMPVAPLISYRVFPPRTIGAVYDGHFARNPVEEVRALIQIWNQCAFERRKIRASLQGRLIGTGRRKGYALVVESL